MANEISYKEVFLKETLIVENNVSLAKKSPEDALYLASLQGGAKVDGYSSVDEHKP